MTPNERAAIVVNGGEKPTLADVILRIAGADPDVMRRNFADAIRAAEEAARREEREACCRAVADAGGDNEDYHIKAVRRDGAERDRSRAASPCTCSTVTGAHRGDCPACPEKYRVRGGDSQEQKLEAVAQSALRVWQILVDSHRDSMTSGLNAACAGLSCDLKAAGFTARCSRGAERGEGGGKCPACGSTVRGERGARSGANGRFMGACSDDWHGDCPHPEAERGEHGGNA